MKRSSIFKNGRLALVGVAVVALALTACSGQPSASSGSKSAGTGSGQTYPLGAILPLSGQNQTFGTAFQQAIQLGESYVNDKMGLNGKVAVDYEDGQGLPAPSVTAMSKLVNVNKSVAVFTGFSAPTQAISALANQQQVVAFNAGANSPALATLGKYVLNDLPLADQQLPAALPYVVDTLKLKNWAIVYSNETLGQSVQAAINKGLPKAGGKVVQSISVSATATDFSPQVDQLRNTKADLIYFAVSSGTQIPTLAQQLRAAGVKAQFMSYGGTDIPAVISAQDTQGMLFTTQHVDLKSTNAPTQYLVKQFKAQHPGTTMTTAQVNYFNAALIIGQSIQKLEKANKQVTGANLLTQIIKGHQYDFAGGSVIINADGTTSTPIDITKLSGQKEQVVKTVAAGK